MKIEKIIIHHKDAGSIELFNVETDPDEIAHMIEACEAVIKALKGDDKE